MASHLELHPLSWGEIEPTDPATYERISSRSFKVLVERTRKVPARFWFTEDPYPPPRELPSSAISLLLAGRTGTVVEHLGDVTYPELQEHLSTWVRVEMAEDMPPAEFEPDPLLNHPGGVTFDQALRILDDRKDTILINWITEDAEAWYFNAYCIGLGCTRVAKQDGSVSRVMNTVPAPMKVFR